MSDELPLIGIAPFCPRCGCGASFIRRTDSVGEAVPVVCNGCGWVGKSPTMIPMPPAAAPHSASKE